MHARATDGDIAMAGIDLGDGAPPEAKAAVAAKLAPVLKADRGYLKSNYSAVSLAEAIRQLLPKAEVTAVARTGVDPSEPTDMPRDLGARMIEILRLPLPDDMPFIRVNPWLGISF